MKAEFFAGLTQNKFPFHQAICIHSFQAVGYEMKGYVGGRFVGLLVSQAYALYMLNVICNEHSFEIYIVERSRR